MGSPTCLQMPETCLQNARNVLSYEDTDADMIRFELTPGGLQLTVNGQCLHKLTDPSN